MTINKRTVFNWLPVVAVVSVNLITLGIIFGTFSTRLDAAEKHKDDLNVHMPYAEKVEQFPTRTEFNTAVSVLQGADDYRDMRMTRMEDKLDKIYDILTEL